MFFVTVTSSFLIEINNVTTPLPACGGESPPLEKGDLGGFDSDAEFVNYYQRRQIPPGPPFSKWGVINLNSYETTRVISIIRGNPRIDLTMEIPDI
jgi:hypothetical protein